VYESFTANPTTSYVSDVCDYIQHPHETVTSVTEATVSVAAATITEHVQPVETVTVKGWGYGAGKERAGRVARGWQQEENEE
jgi:nucleoid DNA-binding protein